MMKNLLRMLLVKKYHYPTNKHNSSFSLPRSAVLASFDSCNRTTLFLSSTLHLNSNKYNFICPAKVYPMIYINTAITRHNHQHRGRSKRGIRAFISISNGDVQLPMLIINGQIEFIPSITLGVIIILITFWAPDLLSLRQA